MASSLTVGVLEANGQMDRGPGGFTSWYIDFHSLSPHSLESRSSVSPVLFQCLEDCFSLSLSLSQHWSRYKDVNLSLISRQKDTVAYLLS